MVKNLGSLYVHLQATRHSNRQMANGFSYMGLKEKDNLNLCRNIDFQAQTCTL